ncbi:AAA family ATPase [Leifsonia sp. A12D58]|uniref:AAA family ATPase n=1 Tax=Leifsonia sp. A12D58 TaxID=3397674 RepID=UPI0039E15E86
MGIFLRAETMHGYYSYLESLDGSPDADLHELSHGESFLELLDRKASKRGFYVLDEPEAALSFTSTLSVVRALSLLADNGSQILCATHSPVLASLPGARILELGDWGIRESSWEDLQIVGEWRSFLVAPERYLNRLLE